MIKANEYKMHTIGQNKLARGRLDKLSLSWDMTQNVREIVQKSPTQPCKYN